MAKPEEVSRMNASMFKAINGENGTYHECVDEVAERNTLMANISPDLIHLRIGKGIPYAEKACRNEYSE
ncbi:hypothetical protein [Paenibacillus sp. Leaf72]|uniref:hypothetical protein n=1 Tax=Paenibacillus sp. Leaf72 TaxID=1736234 RepID=UPI0006FD5C59|nr:hypothetical protein [Paenibacillus sp. Leaf72]KQN96794.1 hypothetical protein ASF12_22235 [Paenibacillus sp. Leaf72]